MRLSGIFIIFLASSVWAQLAVQGPKPVFEGQNVSAIDLIGNPHRDLKPLQPLVVQKAGKPYSQEDVDASIAALQHAGPFSKVDVNVVPDLSGLRLDFLLEPAYFIGMIEFRGAAKFFTYTRLLQVAGLTDEDPYDPARVEVAEQSLQDFLKRNGYFQATIQTSSEIDDAHQIVNVRFVATLGKQARIAKITFQGPDAAENNRLLRSVRSLRARITGGSLTKGKSYTPERITAAITAIRRTLAQQHRLASKVEELAPQFDAQTNRVDVSFKVDVGPLVTVRTNGARLGWLPFLAKREARKLIPVYSEGSIDRDLVSEGQQNLINYFQKQGYSDVQVKITFQRQPTQILLVYDIQKGKKHKVDRIVFRGNHQISEKELLAVVQVKKSHLWSRGSASQQLLSQSAKNLEALYRDRGYEEAKVTPRTEDHEPKISVFFDIEEGSETAVANLQVTGNASVASDQLVAPVGFQLHPGSPFSPRRLAEDRNRISATYLNRGYLNAEVKTMVSREPGDPHRVDIEYAITEHQQVRTGNVIYLGQRHTRLSLIQKAAQVPTAAPMRKGDLLTAESRLYDLNVFDWSSVGPKKPIADQTNEDVLVKVHEAKRNEITYGFGFEISHRGGSTPSGTVAVPGGPPVQLGNNKVAPSQSTFASPRGSVEFVRRNVRGLGETASASILLSRLDQRVLATYTQPHFLGSEWSSLTSVSGEHTTENPLFGATLTDASFQVERLISRRNNTRLQVRYDFNNTILSQLLVPELVLQQDRNIHLSTFSGTLIRDTRDKPLDAHRGTFDTLTLGITPSVLGSSATFARLLGQYAIYRQVRSIVFAENVRIGFVKSFDGSFVPTSQLFFSGGGDSLRGFPINEAGPQRVVPFCDVLANQTGCVNVTVPVGGRQLFILNSEMRFPSHVAKAIGGVIFYDGGNVYSAINLHNFFDNYTNTVGVGLRYSTPIGPIRFDIGRNLNPLPGINPTQYFITVGQSF